MIRVALADDHHLVRNGLRLLLDAQDGIEVVIEAGSGIELIAALAAKRADVVLMDVRMPGMDGLEATRRIVAGDGPAVIVLTTFDVDEYVYEALRAGAIGYLLKSTVPADLVDAVRRAAAGADVLGPTVVQRLVHQYVSRPGPDAAGAALTDLSERELEVLRELARGRSNIEIGQALFISEATVKTHLTRVLAKLGVRDRVQAVIRAYEVGLVEPGSNG